MAAAPRLVLPLARVAAFPTVEGVVATTALPEDSASAARARAAFCRAVKGLVFCAEALVTLLAEAAVVAAVRLFAATEGVEAVIFRLAGAIVLAPAPEALGCGFVVVLVVLAIACLAVDAAVGFVAEDGTGCLRIDFGFVTELCFVFVTALPLPKRVDAGPPSPSSESESTSPSK